MFLFYYFFLYFFFFFFSSRRRHTRCLSDWSSDVCSSDLYEFVYPAKNPVVVGLGLAVVRDFLSYLKYDQQAIAPVKRVYAVGIRSEERRVGKECRYRWGRDQ